MTHTEQKLDDFKDTCIHFLQRPTEKRYRSDLDTPRKERKDKDGRPKSEFLQKVKEEKEQERKRKGYIKTLIS